MVRFIELRNLACRVNYDPSVDGVPFEQEREDLPKYITRSGKRIIPTVEPAAVVPSIKVQVGRPAKRVKL
jgi:hypothetical protein